MLQPNIGFTLRRVLAVFTRSVITPPKVNRFRWNLEHCEYIVGGWPGQILGAIHTVATAGKPGEILFFLSGKQRTIYRFPVGQISRNLSTTRRSLRRWKFSEQNFETKSVLISQARAISFTGNPARNESRLDLFHNAIYCGTNCIKESRKP